MRLECSCGKTLDVAYYLVGKKFRCPGCNAMHLGTADAREPDEQRRLRPARKGDRGNSKPRKFRNAEKRERTPPESFLSRYGLLLGIGGGAMFLGAIFLVIFLARGRIDTPPEDSLAGNNPDAESSFNHVPIKANAPVLSPEEATLKAEGLIQWLIEPRLSDRDYLAKALPVINELNAAKRAELAAGLLIGLLNHEQITVRARTARTLRFIGPQAQKYLSEIVAVLPNQHQSVQREMVQALGFICIRDNGVNPPNTSDVVQALIPLLAEPLPKELDSQQQTGDAPIALYALQALGRIGPAAAEAVPHIIPLLDADLASARSNAAMALGNIGGPAAARAIPTLERLTTSDPSKEVNRNAAFALGKLKSN